MANVLSLCFVKPDICVRLTPKWQLPIPEPDHDPLVSAQLDPSLDRDLMLAAGIVRLTDAIQDREVRRVLEAALTKVVAALDERLPAGAQLKVETARSVTTRMPARRATTTRVARANARPH